MANDDSDDKRTAFDRLYSNQANNEQMAAEDAEQRAIMDAGGGFRGTGDELLAAVAAADREAEFDLIQREFDRAHKTWAAIRNTKPLTSLTEAQAVDAALVLVTERWMFTVEAMRDPLRRRHRCGWCWRAAGGGTDAAWATLPEMTPDEASAHALTCQHNPLVAVAIAARACLAASKTARHAAYVELLTALRVLDAAQQQP